MSSACFHNSNNSEINSKYQAVKLCEPSFQRWEKDWGLAFGLKGQLLSYHTALCIVVKYFVRQYRRHVCGIHTYENLFMTIIWGSLSSESGSKMRGITANYLDLFPTIFILKYQFSFGIQSIFVFLSYKNNCSPLGTCPVSVLTVKLLGLLLVNY